MALRQPYAAFVKIVEARLADNVEPDPDLQYHYDSLYADFSIKLGGYYLAHRPPGGEISVLEPQTRLQLFAFSDRQGTFARFGVYTAAFLAENRRIDDFKKSFEMERQTGASVKKAAEYAENSALIKNPYQ